MAYPECRKLMVDRIKTFITDYKTDGVYVCTRTHSLPDALHADQFGFSPPIVNDAKEVRRGHHHDPLRLPLKGF